MSPQILGESWVFNGTVWKRPGRTDRIGTIPPTVNATVDLPDVTVSDPTGLPTGPDYVSWTSLYNPVNDLNPDGTIDVGDVLSRAAAGKIVTFPAGTYTCADFVSGFRAGISIPSHVKGIIGSGKGTVGGSTGTIFTIKPLSSNAVARGEIPAEGTSQPIQNNVLKHLDSTTAPVYKNFQVAGTSQGHMFSAFQIYGAPAAVTMENVLICGWEGNAGFPPGETSALAIAGVGAHQVTGMEIDGRRTIGGEVFGAMGMTFQQSVGAVFESCNVHHCRAACAVFYQSFNSVLSNCILDSTVPVAKQLGNGGINLERTDGSQLINCTIIGRPGKVHITHSNDTYTLTRDAVTYSTAGGSLEIIDPTYNALWPDGYLYIQTWIPYELGDFGTGNSMTFPNSAAPGPDCSPIVRRANGTNIPYKWVFDQHYLITSH